MYILIGQRFKYDAAFLRGTSTGTDKSTNINTSDEGFGDIVYTGSINKAVYMVKCFSLATSAIGICLQPWLLSTMANSALVFKVTTVCATGFFVFGTPWLLHFLCKRYVTKLYYNKHTKTFTVERLNFFARPKYFSFQPRDIKDSLPNPFSNFEVADQGFLINTEELKFTNPEVYVVFMRYDEPIDLTEYSNSTDSQPKLS